MMMTEEELEDEAAGPAIRDEGVGARVLQLEGPPPAFFAFSGPPTPAAQGGDPEKFKGPGADAAAADAAPGRQV